MWALNKYLFLKILKKQTISFAFVFNEQPKSFIRTLNPTIHSVVQSSWMNRKVWEKVACDSVLCFFIVFGFILKTDHQSLSPPSDHHPGCYFWWRGHYWVRLQGFNGRVRKLPLLLSFNVTEGLLSNPFNEANRQKDDHDLTANEFQDFTDNHRLNIYWNLRVLCLCPL